MWNPTHIQRKYFRCQDHFPLTYPFGMSESSLFPGSFSVCCFIFSSRPAASAPWYWSTRTRFLKNKNVGVAGMLLAAAVAWEREEERFCEISFVSWKPCLKVNRCQPLPLGTLLPPDYTDLLEEFGPLVALAKMQWDDWFKQWYACLQWWN